MQQMSKVSYVFENGLTFGFFDQDCANLSNVLKYSNVNFLNFKPFAPKQLTWTRQLGTEVWSKVNRKTRVREWDTPAEGHACKNAIRRHKRDMRAGAEYACGSGIRVWELDAHFGAEYPCRSGIGLRKWDSVRE